MDSDRVFYAFPFLFVGLWLFITITLRRIAGLERRLDGISGVPIRSSRWGSASINGVAARGCVKLEEHSDGFVLRLMWIFGGGRLWLPKRGLRIGEVQPPARRLPRSRLLENGQDRVILYDELTQFVDAVPPR
jgi:hypothetical protein